MVNATNQYLSWIFLLVFCSLFSYVQTPSEKYMDYISTWKSRPSQELILKLETASNDNDIIEVQVISDVLIKRALKLGDRGFIFQSFHEVAKAQMRLNNYRNALQNINMAMYYTNKKTSDFSSLLLTKATILYETNDLEAAMEANIMALQIAKNKEDILTELQVNHHIALIKTQMNNLSGALHIYLKNKKAYEKIGLQNLDRKNSKCYIEALMAIAKLHAELNNYENAQRACQTLIRHGEILAFYDYKAYGFLILGNIYSKSGKEKQALYYLEEAARSTAYKNEVSFKLLLHLYKARVYYNQQRYLYAISELTTAESFSDLSVVNDIHSREINVLYAKTYQKLNDLERASYYSNKAFDFFEAKRSELYTINTNITQAYDTNGLETEIEAWSSKSKLQKKQLQFSILASFGMACCFLFFYGRYRKRKLLLAPSLGNKTKPTKTSLVLENEKVQELLSKLESFENDEEFLDCNSTLNEVARKLHTNTSYLSKVVNAHKGLTFTKYLTELRLQYAINRLKKDPRFRSYTIKSVAMEAGFKNASTFAKAFKRKFGEYPSDFIRQLNISI